MTELPDDVLAIRLNQHGIPALGSFPPGPTKAALTAMLCDFLRGDALLITKDLSEPGEEGLHFAALIVDKKLVHALYY